MPNKNMRKIIKYKLSFSKKNEDKQYQNLY